MSVPFVRQYPGFRRGLVEIACPAPIEQMAREFIAAGGRYLIEIMLNTKVRVVACMLVDEQQVDVEVIECDNDSKLQDSVNLLISRSIKHVRKEKETRH
jgi:hypothetical protein